MTEDFYDLLEIPSDASQDEIKDAYRQQVRVYHPDHNDDDRARSQFTAVKKAYDILGDPVERKAYDRMGHKDYVAKRTSGLPSPDVWKSTTKKADDTQSTADDSDEADSGTTFTYSDSEASSSSTTTGTTTSSGASGTGAATGAGSTRTTDHTTDSSRSTSSQTGTATETSDGTSGRTDNPLSRWWRRQNFSLPLIWLSVCLYVAGLAHFALANETGLEALLTELQAVGGDPEGILSALSSSRYGIDSSVEFLAAVEFVTPPLEALQWYGALAGVVGVTLAGLLGARLVRDRETWGAVSIDETIVVALAVAVTTTLVGGPLLAGAVLMPLLFGVIVRHTRRGPGWTPSYLYVLPVLAPAVGFALAAAGHATLATDFLTFVFFPIVGALGLPLRATIRKRFGR
ncbi:J domain-containing protein [Natronorubrum sulfidifaciens]|uniref:Heat shock protein DnaJ domain protein n=1 Tax=Natronorubrum sulfidifaciens JCM 14089 TaxID=1230460 RepID=L9VXZ1_9EURY|nr:J domain-containing protein [Natronorubrum sulfidifaciens]ELY42024.1 heat shock protein DnaJ domain protein [Natronorubrum sulfidifaciens JCM 14089]